MLRGDKKVPEAEQFMKNTDAFLIVPEAGKSMAQRCTSGADPHGMPPTMEGRKQDSNSATREGRGAHACLGALLRGN